MMTIADDFRNKVREALLTARQNFDGTDQQFAKQWGKKGINGGVYSRLKKGQIDRVLSDANWITIGRELGVGAHDSNWKAAQTDVFVSIKEEILFCQAYSKSKIFIDECGIGKTFTAKYLSKTLRNCFYVDASQGKTKQLFVRRVAKAIGVDQIGSYNDVKENIKYYLRLLPKPIIIIDEGGDLNHEAFLELKEFWNATEGYCGWYMMGADGLKAKILSGIKHQKVGHREIFSRFSNKFSSVVPTDLKEKTAFKKKLATDVIAANVEDKTMINQLVNRCIASDDSDNVGCLRRVEGILILNQ